MTKPRVSLVLPAYNEAADLRSCLDAIMAQTVAPYEVIVVDNNSTDNTAAIAREYPGVRVLHEKQQGRVFARSRGFNAAHGEVIGRIDVDTIIEPRWVETLQQIFSDDPELAAVSGSVHYYDMPFSRVSDSMDGYFRRAFIRDVQAMDAAFLQGANMGVRRTSWLAARHAMCADNGIHEDFDIAIHFSDLGLKMRQDEHLCAGISARRAEVSFLAFMAYAHMTPHTYALHRKRRAARIYWVYLWAFFGYVPAHLLHRGFDPVLERFSLRRLLFLDSLPRPDPTDI